MSPRLFVLVSYAEDADPGEVTQRYMQSSEFADDIRNFDVADIVGVETTALIPSASSPLNDPKVIKLHSEVDGGTSRMPSLGSLQ